MHRSFAVAVAAGALALGSRALFLRARGVSALPVLAPRRLHVLVAVPFDTEGRADAVAAVAAAVDGERHIVRPLSLRSLVKDPWQDSTAALVLLAAPGASVLDPHVATRIQTFLQASGAVILLSGSSALATLDDVERSVFAPLAPFAGTGRLLVACVPDAPSPSAAAVLRPILARVGVSVSASDEASSGAAGPDVATLVCADRDVWASVWGKCGGASSSPFARVGPKALLYAPGAAAASPVPDAVTLVVNGCIAPSALPAGASEFDWATYFAQLRTDTLGRSVLHFNTVGSTQSVLDPHFALTQALPHGLVIVANRQVTGRGRGGNGWISPPGSMSVTLRLHYPITPPSLVFVQYLAGLAVVNGVRGVPGWADVPLRVKWPNDVYYCEEGGKGVGPDGATSWSGGIKLGGVLVTCSTLGQATEVSVGVGVNVCNPHPTASLSQVGAVWGASNSVKLPALTVESVLARFLNEFERLLSALTAGGWAAVEGEYYARWLHTGSVITVPGAAGPITLQGVHATTGELLGTCEATGEAVALSPGENTFDILKGMVSRKAT